MGNNENIKLLFFLLILIKINKTMDTLKYVNITPSPIKVVGKYRIYGQIGRGSFGIILLAKKNIVKNKKYVSSEKFVILKIPIRTTSKQKKETDDEIRFLFHPKYKKNCKKFYCLKETFLINEERRVIVLDLLDGVHLEKVIRPRTIENARITMNLTPGEKIKFINNFIKSLIKNLQDFHQLGLSHGDIHTGNIMYIPEEKKVVIVDFGMGCKKNNHNYYAECNSGFLTGNKNYQTKKKRNSDSEVYRTFNTIKTHQADDVFALNNIITVDFEHQSFVFKDVDTSKVPILRKWKKAFPLEVIIDDEKRIKAFKTFQV